MIPVYANNRIVELAGPARVARLALAPNVSFIRVRKTNELVRIVIEPRIADWSKPEDAAFMDSNRASYREMVEDAPKYPVLKVVGKYRSMRRWNWRDQFASRPYFWSQVSSSGPCQSTK